MFENNVVKRVNKIMDSIISKILFGSLIVSGIMFKDHPLIPDLFFLCGLFIIIACLFMLHTNFKKSRVWIGVFGTVVDINWRSVILNSGHRREVGREVVTYKTRKLNQHTIITDVINNSPKAIGKKVKIYYNPKDETDILIANFLYMYGKFYLGLACGVMILCNILYN